MKKIFLVISILFFCLFVISPNRVWAVDNNDPSIPNCFITVSTKPITPDKLETVHAISKTERGGRDDYAFSFQTCITDPSIQSDVDSALNSGSDIKLGVRKGLWNWSPTILNRIGNSYCFENDFIVRLLQHQPQNTPNLLLDVETTGGAYPENYPLCQRVKVFPDTVLLDDVPACEAAHESVDCNEITSNPETGFIYNQSIDFSIWLDPLLQNFERCGTDYKFLYFEIKKPGENRFKENFELEVNSNTITYTPTLMGKYTVRLSANAMDNPTTGRLRALSCERSFRVGDAENPGEWIENTDNPDDANRFILCQQVPDTEGRREACVTCFEDDGVWSSLGCISRVDTTDIVDKFMTIGISIAGGIALLMILAAAFILTTSQGEPKRTSEAKEMLTHAVIGLLFIIFSITILEFIGVKILRIPEFGG